jgi:helicase MOV-10
MRQLLRNPDVCIFACAPSNAAADVITLRLIDHLTPEELFRFYAPSRLQPQVPATLLPYTFQGSGHFTVHPLERMNKFRVVISTCVSASVAHGIGMDRGHFSHIFIDEAAQATEPEVMIPIKTMCDAKTNIILSGDPKQLGPIIRSPVAKELGLEVSYLERIMPGQTASEHGQNPSGVS